ncbi:RNA polymerase sigma factor, sigma-70 family [Chthonomonas calidirosea]|uniref:RNA polymerase sigma factor, sigma-70 family n=1 Tax=Chthonomonas calidirosea (strain DSM 23976 / ICMP 18418 / T49) TaxID=1303518 RepID=S0EW47_CHTCT|nr:sigma-70 family RNA polymerase sigma factor [Chthonomonas calidirosea]CCW36088.1 RNA polymerase sigma factor, sigma-70 family [Chthonomonas calidirosea T49]CEK17324.1 RNA polymerase sigma factor, sigma-70 family [Chthonomonas calidirosea]CEK17325.1 RNA polymerase sigma factor, sigma-70 family [Chthonomonas calidirosea]CEK18371.1 RNA polymerase sigma factor, sigma-70 family [Chthonomonas calidirosea]
MDIANLVTTSAKAQNDREEFDRLVRRCHRQAYNIAYRLTGNHADAEDLTQESFLRAYRFFDRYNRSMPFENWLYRIMSRVFIDELRKKPKCHIQSLDQPLPGNDNDSDILLEIPDPDSDPQTILMNQTLEENLQLALNSLPVEFRVAVVLADIEGLSYEEIAQSMGCSLGTVRSRLHRGRKMLRKKLNIFPKEETADDENDSYTGLGIEETA